MAAPRPAPLVALLMCITCRAHELFSLQLSLSSAAIAHAPKRLPPQPSESLPTPSPPQTPRLPCKPHGGAVAAAYSAVTAPLVKQSACMGAERDASRGHSQCVGVRHCESAEAVRLTDGRHMAAMSELALEWWCGSRARLGGRLMQPLTSRRMSR